MLVHIWEYRVRPGCEAAFVEHYGSEGAWVRLFRRTRGHRGTELYRDRAESDRFVTVDRWDSEEVYRAFRDAVGSEFEALDRACEAFTVLERPLGALEVVA